MIKRVLITGATGFIGQHLVKRLLKDGHDITVLSRASSKLGKMFPKKVKVIEADITKAKSLKKIPNDFQLVFHLAAAVSYRNPDKKVFYNVNVNGSRNILTIAEEMDNLKKLIYVSSVGVYGPIEKPPAAESYPHNPRNDYEISKDKGEQIAWEYIKRGLPINIIRPTLVYGPGDMSSGMFRLFKVVAQRKFMKIGKKKVFMHPAYVKNVIDALILASESKVLGEDFIIGDRDYLALKDLVDIIALGFKVKLFPFEIPEIIGKILGRIGDLIISLGIKFPLSSGTIDFMTQHRAYEITKAKRLLGYRPKFSLKKGVMKSVVWYKKRGYI